MWLTQVTALDQQQDELNKKKDAEKQQQQWQHEQLNNHTVTDTDTDIQPSHILVLEKLLNENELIDSDLIEDIQSDVFYECMSIQTDTYHLKLL